MNFSFACLCVCLLRLGLTSGASQRCCQRCRIVQATFAVRIWTSTGRRRPGSVAPRRASNMDALELGTKAACGGEDDGHKQHTALGAQVRVHLLLPLLHGLGGSIRVHEALGGRGAVALSQRMHHGYVDRDRAVWCPNVRATKLDAARDCGVHITLMPP